MLLTHAQGVSSSIEDAAALEVLLSGLSPSPSLQETLTHRLSVFETLRLPRVAATQILTEPIVPGPMFIENGKKAEARIRQYYDGPLPPMTSVPHSVPICDFFFGYDVSKDAREALEKGTKTQDLAGELAEELKTMVSISTAEVTPSPDRA